MLFTAENILLVGSILLFVSIIVGKTGYRFGVPALLLFSCGGHAFRQRRTRTAIPQRQRSAVHRYGGFEHYPVFGRNGYQVHRNQAYPLPGIVLSTFGVLLTALFTGLFIWWLSGMSWTNIHLPLITSPAAGFHHVVYGLGIGIRHPALAEDEPEAQPASHAGVGKRKQRPDGLYADCRTYPAHPVLGYGCFADSFLFS